jgi:hypothetical protein
MSKIDRAILVLSDNPLYEGFWEYSSKFWANKFGIKPTLFFYGEEKRIKVDKTIGEVYNLPFVESVCVNPNRDWTCTWGLFYGASMFPDETCITCGLDQAFLSDKFFKEISGYDFEKDYVVGLSDAYNRDDWLVSSHHVAKGRIFKEALSIDGDWKTEVEKVFSSRHKYGDMYGGGDFWGLDELYSSEKLTAYPNLKKHKNFFQYLRDNRLDREINLSVNLERLQSGGYSEIHCPRPYKNYSEFLETIYQNAPCFLNTKQQ